MKNLTFIKILAPLKVRKPAAVLFDLVATATKSFFIDQVLFPYIKQNAKQYLVENWDNEVVQNDVTLLRKAAAADKGAPKIAPTEEGAEAVQATAVLYIDHCLEQKKDNEGMTLLRFHVLFDGYARGRLETPLYTDVAIQMHHWAVEDKVKLYLFSNGWKEATKRYLAKTNQGDMNLLIADHFDTEEGQLTDPATFKKIVGKIKQVHPEDVLFLTHCPQEAMAAKSAGLGTILIMTHRRDVNKLSVEEKRALPYVRSFNEIIFTGDAPKATTLDGSSVPGDEGDEGDGKEDGKKSKTPSSSLAKTASKKAAKKKSKPKSKSSSSKVEKSKKSNSKTAHKSSSTKSSGSSSGSSGSQSHAKSTTVKDEPKAKIEFGIAKFTIGGSGGGSKPNVTKSSSSSSSKKCSKSSDRSSLHKNNGGSSSRKSGKSSKTSLSSGPSSKTHHGASGKSSKTSGESKQASSASSWKVVEHSATSAAHSAGSSKTSGISKANSKSAEGTKSSASLSKTTISGSKSNSKQH